MFEKLFGKNKISSWPFKSPENEMVITVKQIVDKKHPILLVAYADDDEPTWQFLTGEHLNIADVMMVSLKNITDIDPSIFELADLPLGWQAERKNSDSPWIKSKDS